VLPDVAGAELLAVQASTDLAVGQNRFVLGLIGAHNQPIIAGVVHLEFFRIDSTGAVLKGGTDAVFRSISGQQRGVWVSPVAFDAAGPWRVEVRVVRPEAAAPLAARLNFEVQSSFSAPADGEAAPVSSTPTTNDVAGDLTRICSHQPPCTLHEVSLDTLLRARSRPVVVAFATPAFCTSATCGPQLDVVLQLHQAYLSRADFVHVEIYRYPFEQRQPARAVDEWNLPSEPWTFVIDRAGVVRGRFEGVAPFDELEPALLQVLE
jgi:hypothetical protein